ncbi:MAG: hypothetical protein GY822_09460 [Deltaproteobacteria bacterium]|nr:hypothetical protein [Deltaproteobacteria bacterium]
MNMLAQRFLNDWDLPKDDLSLEKTALNVEHDDFNLFSAAASLSRVDGRSVDLHALHRGIDEIAAQVSAEITEIGSEHDGFFALQKVLFEGYGFRGDSQNYHAPENSYLEDVFDRRRGIPIALGMITCEVARRANVSAYEIAFPGHFLVGVHQQTREGAEELLIIDPFHGGRLRSTKDLEGQLARLARRRIPLQPEHLAPASARVVLMRMLNNLRSVYVRLQDPFRLERVLSRLLILAPGAMELNLERSRARRLILDYEGACADAEEVRNQSRKGELRAAAEDLLGTLERDMRWIH